MADKLTIQSEVDISLKDKGKEADGQLGKILKKIKSIEESVKKQTTATVNGFNKVTSALKKTDKAAKTLEKTEKRSGKSRLKQVATTITMYAGIGTAIYGTIAAIKKMASEVLELNRDLAKAAAITGSSSEAIAKLKSIVISTAASFNVGTDELGKFVITASKLGLSADEVGVLSKEAITLSKILGEDMSESGKLIVTTLKAFNMTMEESSEVTAVFFDLIRKTPAGINELKTAMQYVAPAANAVGVSLKDAGKMMELLFNRGLKASKVGTGLRNMFAEISESGSDVMEVLEDMSKAGFSFSDAVDQFGKRGAIAATLLVQNFGELKNLMAEDLPTSFDILDAALIATTNELDTFGRAWESVKLPFAGTDAFIEWSKNNSLRSFREYLKEYNIEAQDIYKDINESVTKGFDKQQAIAGISNKFGLRGGTGGLSVLYDMYKKQQDEADAVKTAKKAAMQEVAKVLNVGYSEKDTINTLLDKYIKSEGSGVDAITKIGSLYQGASDALDASPDNLLLRALRNEYQSINATASTITSISQTVDETIADYKKYYDSTGEIIKISTNNTKEWIDYEAKAKKKLEIIKSLCESNEPTVHAMGLCSQFDKGKSQITDVRGDYGIDKANLGGLDLDMYNKLGLNTSALKKAISEGADEYSVIKAISEAADNTTDAIDKALSDNKIKIAGFYTRAIEIEADTIRVLEALVISDPKNKDRYLEQIKTYKANAIELQKELADMLKETTDKANKAKGDVNKKEQSLIVGITGITDNEIKDQEDKQKQYLKLVSDGIAALADIYGKFAQENLNNRLDSIAAELEAVQSRSDVESDILSSQFDNNIITAEAYAKKREELEKREIEQKNALNKAAFEAQKKSDISSAIANGVAGAAQAFIQSIATYPLPAGLGVALAASGIVAAKSGAEVAAISQRKFYPVKYADGGEVVGASHAEGGIPFSVAGQGGYEMEGGEYIVNKEATARNKALLDAINFKDKKYSDSKFFANGGSVGAVNGASETASKEQVIRAYITKRDLRDYTDNESRNSKIRKL